MNKTVKVGCLFLIFAVTVFSWYYLFAEEKKGERILPDRLLFQNDFSETDVTGLVKKSGEWEISDGMYLQEKKIEVSESLIEGSYGDFIVQAKVMLTGGATNKKVFFKLRDNPSGFYEVYISNYQQAVGVMKNVDGKWLELKTTTIPIELNAWYIFKTIIKGSHIDVYLNGKLYINIEDESPSFSSGELSVGTYEAEAKFDDIKVWSIKTEPFFNFVTPPSARVWQQPDDFSNVQGEKNWYYLHSPRSNFAAPFQKMDWDKERNIWAQDPWARISLEKKRGMVYLSNSAENREDQILAWKSPVEGVVSVIGIAQNFDIGGDYAKNTDGYFIEIRKNNSPEPLWNNFWDNTFWDIQPFMLKVPVNAGDFLYFRLATGEGHGHYDSGLIQVTIVYPALSQ